LLLHHFDPKQTLNKLTVPNQRLQTDRASRLSPLQRGG
jgi:hypothetical protein